MQAVRLYNSRFPLRDGRRDSCNFDFNSVESCRITGSDRIVFMGGAAGVFGDKLGGKEDASLLHFC